MCIKSNNWPNFAEYFDGMRVYSLYYTTRG